MSVIGVVGVVLFALGIGVSIALHEAGHLLTAKWFGMKVRRYFIGFGPKIFSFRRGETEYGLKAIPAGGFCDIMGMTALDEDVQPTEAPRAFYRQAMWKRVIVLAAGSVTHFIIGVLVVFVMSLTTGLPNVTPISVVGDVSQCVSLAPQNATTGEIPACAPNDPAPAKNSGLRSGDKILSVAGVATANYVDLVKTVRSLHGPTPFVIERDGKQQTLTVDIPQVPRLALDTPADKNGKPLPGGKTEMVGAIGLGPASSLHYTPSTAIPATVGFTGFMFENTWHGLMQLPQRIPSVIKAIGGGERDVNSPVSVVGATVIGGQAAERGLWSAFLLLLAGLNFFVGAFNLVPLLPLDGGHIAVGLFEKVRDAIRRLRGLPAGGPVDYTKLLPLTYLVILVGGAVTLLTVTADIVNPIKIG